MAESECPQGERGQTDVGDHGRSSRLNSPILIRNSKTAIFRTQSPSVRNAARRLTLAVIGAVPWLKRQEREGVAKAKAEGRSRGRVPTARRQAAENHSGWKKSGV